MSETEPVGNTVEPELDWPYETRSLIENPKYTTIEQHAVSVLNRALDLGRTIAFVGAGVSMAYGRISWKDLVYAIQNQVTRNYWEKLQVLQSEIMSIRAASLYGIVDGNRVERSSGGNALWLPELFQLCEQLDDAIEENIGPDTPKTEPDLMKLRRSAMKLVKNEEGHGRQILYDALTDRSSRIPLQDRNTPGRAASSQDVEDFASFHKLVDEKLSEARIPPNDPSAEEWHEIVQRYFCIKALKYVSSHPPGDIWTSDLLSVARGYSPSGHLLRPTHRFLIGALLRLLPEERRMEVFLEMPEVSDRDSLHTPRMPDLSDPLVLLTQRLGIRRFLTTNYDVEIEKMLEDTGFRAASSQSYKDDRVRNASVDPTSPGFRDFVFTAERTGDLVAMAAQDRHRAAAVAHLHGRADDVDTVIVSERDYQGRYARVDETRPMIDDAIGLAFAANPMLFVGSGMGEDDILRQLRQFMSTPGRGGERVCVALLPYDRSQKDAQQQKIDLLHRYGVYAIHFGYATFEDEAKKKLTRTPWLSDISSVRRTIEGILNELWSSNSSEDVLCNESLCELFLKRVNIAVNDIDNKLDQMASDGPSVKTTTATGVRPDNLIRHLVEPQEIEGQSITNSSEFSLSFEIDMLNAAIKFVRNLDAQAENYLKSSSPPRLEKAKVIRRATQAYRIALAGADDAIKAKLLCARLVRAEQDWKDWKPRWFKIPSSRRPKNDFKLPNHPLPTGSTPFDAQRLEFRDFEYGALSNGQGGETGIKLTLRNALALPADPTTDERFYSGAPSQTFHTLAHALSRYQDVVNRTNGRRILVLIAEPGLGKGYFFSALQDPAQDRRLWWLLRLFGGRKPRDGRPQSTTPKRWSIAAFFNLSFSNEVASVFDRISSLIHDEILGSYSCCYDSDTKERFERQWDILAHDQIGQLRYGLSELSKWASSMSTEGRPRHEPRRIVIVLNAINVLFSPDGRPRNEQIRNVFDALLGDEAKSAPIDLILISTDVGIPEHFRSDHGRDGLPLILLREPFEDILRGHAVERRVAGLRLKTVTPERINAVTDSKTDFCYVHFLQRARVIVSITAFFPCMALAIARNVISTSRRAELFRQKLPPESASTVPSVISLEQSVQWQKALRDTVANSQQPLSQIAWKKLFSWLLLTASVRLRGGDADICGLLKQITDAIPTADSGKKLRAPGTVIPILLDILVETICGLPPDSKDLFLDAADAIDDEMQALSDQAGGGRFIFTALISATSEFMNPSLGTASPPGGWGTAATNAMNFLHRTLLVVYNLGRRRDDILIGRVLELYKQRHIANEPLPRPGNWTGCTTAAELYRLQDLILWHLAMIGEATEKEVLAYCPQIRVALQAVTKDKQAHRLVLAQTFELLLHRCLIYKLHPGWVARDVDGADGKLTRYSVHRLIQRHLFRQIGAPFVEHSEADQFMLTLYASQPNDLPRLPYEVHLQVRQTVAALSGYPDDPAVSEHYGKEWDGSSTVSDVVHGKPICRRMLRAALGIMRSIYSVAVLARLDLPVEMPAPRTRDLVERDFGLLEDNRRQVRWLLLRAAQLEDDNSPFYQGEIAWLFNESAVLSLAQGRLSDAVVLFNRALVVARQIEADESGSLHTRILLNLAAANVERGRSAAALGDLERIARSEAIENGVPSLIAKGYLGLIAHLAGDHTRARNYYCDEVIQPLISRGQLRAASIFSRHFGDLLRDLGDVQSRLEAEQQLNTAINLAFAGGHEDVRHLATLSLIKLRIADKSLDNLAKMHNELDVVERYARVIGMPRISTEVAELRARIYLHAGDVKMAGTMATQGLEIASRNELRIRRINLLLLLAEVNARRGQNNAAFPLLDEAAASARDAECHYVRARIQDVRNSLHEKQRP